MCSEDERRMLTESISHTTVLSSLSFHYQALLHAPLQTFHALSAEPVLTRNDKT